jgi:hypothetical protein
MVRSETLYDGVIYIYMCVCMYVSHTRETSEERGVGWPSGGAGGRVESPDTGTGTAPGVAPARGGNTTGGPTTILPWGI